MSKKARKRYTRRERRGFALRPHPPEKAIPKADLDAFIRKPIETKVEEDSEDDWNIETMEHWHPMMGDMPFPDVRTGINNKYDVHDRRNSLI